jgi:universal stress protein A
MMPFSKILVPIDFSSHATHALGVAADLAGRYQASVTVTHVYEPIVYTVPESLITYMQEQTPQVLGELQKMLDKAQHDARALGVQHVDTKLLQGGAASELVRFADEGGYDLIVIGTHGRSGISHLLLGSVAEKVIRSAHCPVMTVRIDPKRVERS